VVTSNLTIQALGKYRLIEQIGQGGMATVYKAFDPELNREVALKVLSPIMAQEAQFSKRFEREAEVVMRLSHPNIVPVIDYGQDAGYAYLVMPLLQVGSLADRLADGPLTPAQGGRLLTQLSSALDFAHEQGIIHRDVKPSNVLLDEQGNALLADFGLARIHDASVSLTGSALLGTPAYMSPEQARGERVGPASDQYSLGVILYQLCTGTLPFAAETPMAVMLKHINEPLPLVRDNSPNVPEPIEHVILKATAKHPEQRFGTVMELNAAFQAALAHAQDPFANPAPRIELPPSSVVEPVEIPAVPVPTPKPRRSRLGRLAAAAAALLLLLLACPSAFPSVVDRLAEEFVPAEGSGLSPDEMSESQLTALAGTIEALSTQLAASGDGTQSPEQIQTAVMETLSAGGGPFADPSATPGLFLVGGGTPSGTPTPGPSPTASLSPTPGPSPTASRTPTITYTPSPGPSPTPSRTPTPSKTPTVTYTASPGPSPTPSRTPTPTWTATFGPSSTSSPFPSGTPMTSTASPTPNATSTVVAFPTDAPTVIIDPCEGIKPMGLIVSPPIIELEIFNGSTEDIVIQWVNLWWPAENLKHLVLELDGKDVIWDAGNTSPPTFATSLKGDRTIENGDSRHLGAVFEKFFSGLYRYEVGFKNGCTISYP
jgi:serine/threonine-protein kinase